MQYIILKKVQKNGKSDQISKIWPQKMKKMKKTWKIGPEIYLTKNNT